MMPQDQSRRSSKSSFFNLLKSFWQGTHAPKVGFVLLFILLFFFLGYHKLWTTGPTSIHAWRQSDSYGMTLAYYYENHPLFEPHVLYIGENGHRQAVSEFPIIYYLTAKIWKITGIVPGVLRMINFLLLLLGLYHLMKLSHDFLEDRFWAIFCPLLLFSSPLLGYYSYNFIPDIPAFGLALTGLYYLYRFVRTNKNKALLLGTLAYTLAVLLKVTAVFSLLAFLATLTILHFREIRKYRVTVFRLLVSILLIFGVYIGWNRYASAYNKEHIEGFFLQSALPIWDINKERILEILQPLTRDILPKYFSPLLLGFSVIVFILIMVKKNAIDRHLRLFTLFAMIGLFSFILLFYQGMNVHDYFLINTLCIIPAIALSGLLLLKKQHFRFYQSTKFRTISIITLIVLLNNNMLITRSHYNPHQPMVKYNLPLSKHMRGNWGYFYWRRELEDFQYEGIADYVRSIGIQYSDKVISIGDYSPERTLSWMEVQGFTDYGYNRYPLGERMEKLIGLGATYLVVNPNDQSDTLALAPYTGKQIGQYNNIRIYRLPEANKPIAP